MRCHPDLIALLQIRATLPLVDLGQPIVGAMKGKRYDLVALSGEKIDETALLSYVVPENEAADWLRQERCPGRWERRSSVQMWEWSHLQPPCLLMVYILRTVAVAAVASAVGESSPKDDSI